MKNVLTSAVLLFFTHQLFAQIGLVGAYKSMNVRDWAGAIEERTGDNISNLTGYNLGIDYWFRLKNYRVEFTPELSYEKYETSLQAGNLEHRLLNFHFNTNIYPFDIENDCNCPTWSKKGNFLTKGFFIQLSLGASRFDNSLKTELVALKDDAFAWTAGGGVGIDFGISDHITVTPLVKYYYYPSAEWEGLMPANPAPGQGSNDTSITQFYAGLKLAFRLKSEKRRF